jgi:hypothetical protein
VPAVSEFFIEGSALIENSSYFKSDVLYSPVLLENHQKGDLTMSDEITTVKIGQQVPDFELTVYEPENHGFGKRNLADLKKAGKWTILFFYPADFTFV